MIYTLVQVLKMLSKEQKETLVTTLISTFSFGPGMKTPKDIFDLFKLNNFKKELLRFFITEYHYDEYAVILSNKVLCYSVDNECKKFSTISGLIEVENIPELYGNYLEADTRVTFHAKHTIFSLLNALGVYIFFLILEWVSIGEGC